MKTRSVQRTWADRLRAALVIERPAVLEKEGTGNSIDPFPIRVAHLQYIGFASLGALVLKVLLDLRVNAIAISVNLSEATMADQFAFDVEWIIVSVVIGLLVALIGALLYPRRDHD